VTCETILGDLLQHYCWCHVQ